MSDYTFKPIEVNGCLIEPNTIYEIVSKEPPSTAPQFYKDLGSYKEKYPGISNFVTLSQYNTGFFPESEIFNLDPKLKKNASARAKKAEELYNTFAKPLGIYYKDIEQIKNPTNDEFFDNYYSKTNSLLTVDVSEGSQFNTESVIQRFKLYIAIIEGAVCMKGKRDENELKMGLRNETDSYYNDVPFAYISIDNRKTRKEKIANLEMDSHYKFGDLLRGDKETLIGILNYMGIKASMALTPAELNTIYKTKIDLNIDRIKQFLNVIDKYEDNPDSFKLEIQILNLLKSKKGREVINREGNTMYLGEIPLGSNHKSAVITLMKDDELLKEFLMKAGE